MPHCARESCKSREEIPSRTAVDATLSGVQGSLGIAEPDVSADDRHTQGEDSGKNAVYTGQFLFGALKHSDLLMSKEWVLASLKVIATAERTQMYQGGFAESRATLSVEE